MSQLNLNSCLSCNTLFCAEIISASHTQTLGLLQEKEKLGKLFTNVCMNSKLLFYSKVFTPLLVINP